MQAKTLLGQQWLHQREQTEHKQSPNMLHTIPAMIPTQEGTKAQLHPVSLQPGEGSAAQNSPKALCTAHIHRATVHSFFLKTLGCWGTAAAPTALWRADKPCALRKIAVPSPFQAMSCKLHFTCFISYDKCRVVKHLLGKLGRGEVVAL